MSTVRHIKDIVEGVANIYDFEENESVYKIASYLYNIGLKNFPLQADISKSKYIEPYVTHFLDLKLKPGLYVMDNMDIYHPVDNGSNGISHFLRHDSDDMKHNSIVAISEMRNMRLVFFPQYVLLIIGIIETKLGYNFLTNISGCLPVAALKITNYIEYTFEDVEEEEKPESSNEVYYDYEEEPVYN